MTRPSQDRWARRADEFDRRPLWTAFKWALGAALLVLLLMLVLMPFGWGFAWLSKAKEVTGPANTERQATALRDDWASLEATAGNVCDAAGSGGSDDENDPQIVGGTPGFQYRATYRRIKADYDRRMANAFEAGWVRRYPFLRDLPREAPGLKAMQERVC